MATLTTTQTSPSLLGGVVIIGGTIIGAGDVLPAGGHVRGVVLLVDGGAGLYLVLYAALRADDPRSQP
ncbi:tryptophan permease [Salmonella enterica subsp. enterica]|uniref:Tryptophan permease n=1 Tax=Salmonella enterica I TaxID=59201 RepID=A0A3S4IYL0_SALET|nr:tryptophan permease [Salmonella enterica subsp. enterica]